MSEELNKLKELMALKELEWKKEKEELAAQLEASTKASDEKSTQALVRENNRLKKEMEEAKQAREMKDKELILNDLKQREFDIKNFQDLDLASLTRIQKALEPLQRDDKGVVIPKRKEPSDDDYKGPMVWSDVEKKLVPWRQ